MRTPESNLNMSPKDSLYKTAPRLGVGGALDGKAVGIYDKGAPKLTRKEYTKKNRRSI